MRKLLIGGVLAAALASAAPASAGCWATVGLAPPPAGTTAGEVWTARITVLQHGRNPLPDAASARPTLTIVNRATGVRQTFTATPSDPAAGRYEARVVFPSPGAWRYEVFDGFTSWNGTPAPCGKTHTFAGLQVAGTGDGAGRAGGSAFSLWPVVAGSGALAAAAIALAYVLRRRGPRAPAPA